MVRGCENLVPHDSVELLEGVVERCSELTIKLWGLPVAAPAGAKCCSPARKRWESEDVQSSPGRGGTRKMAHTFTQHHMHVVFSTKNRRKLIIKETQEPLWKYLTGICHNIDLIPVAIGGVDNHVHMLFHLPPSRALGDAVRLVKTNSSKWMNEHGKEFAWQEGYGAFAVSASNLKAVVRYIHNQEQHHRKMSFEEEYLELLRRHGIEFDPRFVFD
jgi:putative transposase